MASHDSPSQLAFGSPSAEDWSRRLSGTAVKVSAHNHFIEAYLRLGLPGAVILCSFALLVWFHREEVAPVCGLTPHAVPLLLLTQLVLSLTFGLDAPQGLIAGIFVSGLALSAPAQIPASAPTPTRATGATPRQAAQ
jgi:hypothetical protein